MVDPELVRLQSTSSSLQTLQCGLAGWTLLRPIWQGEKELPFPLGSRSCCTWLLAPGICIPGRTRSLSWLLTGERIWQYSQSDRDCGEHTESWAFTVTGWPPEPRQSPARFHLFFFFRNPWLDGLPVEYRAGGTRKNPAIIGRLLSRWRLIF